MERDPKDIAYPSGDGWRGKLNQSFHVGTCLVEPDLNQIAGKEGAIRIEPKSMKVLLCLAEQPGRVVTRQELLGRVWEGTIVEENTLSRCVSQLRKAFGDSARQPRFIETIPKTGYRLIATITAASQGDALPSLIGAIDVQPATGVARPAIQVKYLSRVHKQAISVFLASIVFFAAYQGWRMASASQLVPVRHMPLTSYEGIERDPAFSPDGNRIAFIRQVNNGNPDIYVKVLDEESVLRLTETPAYEGAPAWSPDGSSIAYIRRDSTSCSIMRLAALGGIPRKLSSCGIHSAFFLDWSPDGEHLVYSERDEASRAYQMTLLNVETLEQQTIVEPPADAIGDMQAVFSPDGQSVAFYRRYALGFDDVFTISLADQSLIQITTDLRFIGGVDWANDGERLFFSSNRDGGFKLWEVAATGGTPAWLASIGAYDPGKPRTGIHDDELAYVEWFYDTNIWLHPLEGNAEPIRHIASTRWDQQPQFSPDGSRIAFVSNRSGSNEIWVLQADATRLMRLTHFNEQGHVGFPRWSPDGQEIVFEVRHAGMSNIYRIDAFGGKPQPLTESASINVVPIWSSDGMHIYFSSNRTGDWHIWRIARSGGYAEQVTKDRGYYAQVGRDESVLYFNKHNEPGIWRLNLTTQIETLILPSFRASLWGNWVVHEEWLYYARLLDQGRLGLERMHLETQDVEPMLETEAAFMALGPELSISQDGQYVLYTQIDQLSSDIILVTGVQ